MTPKHISEVTEIGAEILAELRAGGIKREDASEALNAIGKICSTLKVQIAYNALRNEVPNIPFLTVSAIPRPVHVAQQERLALEGSDQTDTDQKKRAA